MPSRPRRLSSRRQKCNRTDYAAQGFLTRLKLVDFRNYAGLSLDLDERHVVLTGENGSRQDQSDGGRLLPLARPRPALRTTYGDVARVGSDGSFSVFAELEGMEGGVELGTGTLGGEDGQSRLRLNGTTAKSVDELLDHLRVLWLTLKPLDGLFTGGSGDRRRFLDRLVLSLDPEHGRRATDFERAMRSRNKLLSEPRPDPVWLTGLERQMAELGISMAHARHEMLSLLATLVEKNWQGGVFPAADLALSGFLDGEWHRPAVDLEEQYLDMLQAGRYRDAAGRPHAGWPASQRSPHPPPGQGHGSRALFHRRAEGAAGRPRCSRMPGSSRT